MDFVISPVAVKMNAASGGGAQALQPGQVVEALVAKVIDPAHIQLALGATLIDVQTEVPLVPGSRVQLAVRATPDGLRLVLLQPAPSGKLPATEAPSPSARTVTPSVASGPGIRGTPEAPTTTSAAPAAALATAVRSAAVTQSGLAPLLADAAVAASLRSLPEPVRQAVLKLLSFQLPSETTVEAEQLRRAFARSGLFLEANLDHAAAKPSAGGAAPAPAGDLKAALVALRATLTGAGKSPQTQPPAGQGVGSAADAAVSGALASAVGPAAGRAAPADVQGLYRALLQATGETAAAAAAKAAVATNAAGSGVAPTADTPDAYPGAASASNRPPPPYRGALPAAQPQAQPSVGPATPPDKVVEALLAGTDGALARQTLLQAASLPDDPTAMGAAQKADASAQRWTFEIPFATPQGPAIAQFEIASDAHGRGQDRTAPIWRARFAIDIEPLGAIHAQVAVMGERTAVTLWAERAESAVLMRDSAQTLTDDLRAAELEPLEVIVRDGAPRQQANASTPAGRFLDRAS
ncbi:MAG: flagellar hook-length control protein FliK [Xanthobacteraceae bacterium]